jgi:hypothetical protein
MTPRNQDPEDVTIETIIGPLLRELGYTDLVASSFRASGRVSPKLGVRLITYRSKWNA